MEFGVRYNLRDADKMDGVGRSIDDIVGHVPGRVHLAVSAACPLFSRSICVEPGWVQQRNCCTGCGEFRDVGFSPGFEMASDPWGRQIWTGCGWRSSA
jgi:hypothetical protein